LTLTPKSRVLGVLTASASGGAALPVPSVDSLRRLASTVALAIDVQLLGEEERKRRERERMLATALATMDQPVFILSLERRVLYANAAAMREYGYHLDELVEMSIDSLAASAVPARHQTAGVEEFSSGSMIFAEPVHRRPDGSQFPAAAALRPAVPAGVIRLLGIVARAVAAQRVNAPVVQYAAPRGSTVFRDALLVDADRRAPSAALIDLAVKRNDQRLQQLGLVSSTEGVAYDRGWRIARLGRRRLARVHDRLRAVDLPGKLPQLGDVAVTLGSRVDAVALVLRHDTGHGRHGRVRLVDPVLCELERRGRIGRDLGALHEPGAAGEQRQDQ
jgi:PAS domain S-box-containing protein